MVSLDDRMQALPQELQDMIFECTLTTHATTPSTVVLTPAHRPPRELQINRKTRAAFASTYYSTTTFRVQLNSVPRLRVRLQEPRTDAPHTMACFLSSLPTEHLRLLQRVEYEDLRPIDSRHPGATATNRRASQKSALPTSVKAHLDLKIVAFSYIDVADGGKVKWLGGEPRGEN